MAKFQYLLLDKSSSPFSSKKTWDEILGRGWILVGFFDRSRRSWRVFHQHLGHFQLTRTAAISKIPELYQKISRVWRGNRSRFPYDNIQNLECYSWNNPWHLQRTLICEGSKFHRESREISQVPLKNLNNSFPLPLVLANFNRVESIAIQSRWCQQTPINLPRNYQLPSLALQPILSILNDMILRPPLSSSSSTPEV